MQLLDGKKIATEIQNEIREKVEELKSSSKKIPHLAAILVGSDGASETYVQHKVKACSNVGFESSLIRLDQDISENELLSRIESLNENTNIDGFIVQLPLPKHIDPEKIRLSIDPSKDVDGFHPTNVGKMAQGINTYLPATPMGILELIKRYNIVTKGKHCVIVGRSQIVGSPMSILMSSAIENGNATVTLCHRFTENLEKFTREADILIVATGIPGLITARHVKEGAVVIDVGTTRVPDATKRKGYRLRGDVDFESVSPKCSYITPVPGGVGPLTVTALLLNTLKAATEFK
ncbi:MAG: bifunctional 5,10-methylene-tetrahydrofolate dehydrogenase/5,10-methylene-tetrahydrofolate cyclohydrolase [Chitinophagaceae bacterium]|nr:MAG: bifunctional 5,10-methylene-tetrahydrofolate dehydrogenase/5,10-methylene-tetrahydrofolate cyclohydrolase [Chitinophagaceae bacterium]